MKKLFAGFIYSLCALMSNGAALAADRGTADEAVAMVKKAVAYLKANGKALSHGVNPKLIGKNVSELKDVDGKYFVKTYLELAASKGKGWTDYMWVNPVTSAIEHKSTYVEKVDDLVVGSGIYKQ